MWNVTLLFEWGQRIQYDIHNPVNDSLQQLQYTWPVPSSGYGQLQRYIYSRMQS